MGVNSVAAQTFKGSFFSIGSAVITIVSGFVRTVILARLLLPEHFGAVALAMFLGFLTLLLALLLRRLYPSQPQMVSALVALSCVEIVKAVNSTPDILLRKELAFRYLAILDVSSSLAMTVVAPAMAWAGFGFWSLVGEQAVSVVVRTAGLWVIRRPWPFSLHFDKDIARWYFRFGSFVFLSSSFTFLLDQFDDFWTGTALGATALGFYSRAYEFARYPRRVYASLCYAGPVGQHVRAFDHGGRSAPDIDENLWIFPYGRCSAIPPSASSWVLVPPCSSATFCQCEAMFSRFF